MLGAELVRHDKPEREVYQSAAGILDLGVGEVMNDLRREGVDRARLVS